MCCKGFVKRVLPFFLTFAVGLFIASFFVTVTAPTFQFSNRSWKRNHRQYDRQRELEIQRLREENMRLKNQILNSDLESVDFQELRFPVPPTVKIETADPVSPSRTERR